MARMEGCDWSIKLNIKLKFIYPDRLTNSLVRIDVILLIIGMSSCTPGARVDISRFVCILGRQSG